MIKALLICILLLPSVASARKPDNGPTVTIDNPIHGSVTHHDEIDVIVSFEARGNVTRVELYLNEDLIGFHTNPPQVKEGSFIFNVDLTDHPEGEAILTAFAFQGNPNAGNFSDTSVAITIDRTDPVVMLSAPMDDTVTTDKTIEIVGTVNEPSTIRIGDVATHVKGLGFTTTVTLREGTNLISVSATDPAGNTAADSVVVLRDTTPPRVQILSPTSGARIQGDRTTVTGLVSDLVVGTVDAGDVAVTVNGVPATVDGGGFVAMDVPVAQGAGTIVAIARDRTDHTATSVIPVIGDTTTKARIVAVSGDGQTAVLGTELPTPLVVRLEDSSGAKVPDLPVTFEITRGDGALGSGQRSLTVTTNAEGLASIAWWLGSRTGSASDQVRATAPRFFGEATFSATATVWQQGPRQLYAIVGQNQIAAIDALAPEPLTVLLTDERGNPVADVDVIFEVAQGGGKILGTYNDSDSTAVVTTDADGRAHVLFTLGSDPGTNSQLVEARMDGASSDDGGTVHFVASSVIRADAADTAISGVVMTNDNVPIEGVRVLVASTGEAPTSPGTMTNAEGRFHMIGVPPGHVHVYFQSPSTDIYPGLSFERVLVEGAENPFERPIYLPTLDDDGVAWANADTPSVITRADTPGLEMSIPAGSATFLDGSREGFVQIIRVHRDKIPMQPPNGTLPRLAISIQPSGTRFDPPAPIRFPNVDGRQPGEVVTIYSFDHDLGEFIAIGTAQVSEDGLFVASEPGQGIVKAGWHAIPPDPDPTTCVGAKCVLISCTNESHCENGCQGKSCGPFACEPPPDGLGTPDVECYSCAGLSSCNANPNSGGCTPDGLATSSNGETCTRLYDPVHPDLTGEPGTCRTTDDSPGLAVCCPDGHWAWGEDQKVCCLTPVDSDGHCV